MSRNGVLLSAVCLQAREEIDKFLEKDPFSVGVYCAVENGPVDLESTKALIGSTRENFAAMYKKHRNPKLYFKQLPNLAAAHMGSFLGLNGPMHVYNNSSIGSLHALEQAEMDLMDRRVSAALVCSAFSFEIPIMLERIKRTSLGERILCEGAGAMLLTSNEREIDWKDFNYQGTSEYYGISHQIIIQAIKRRTLSGDRTGNI
ncbi:MAG TPA: hypothetical protein ENH31_06115 [Nitrospirae bacterium]|nr:hypothetical protein BMS3Abin10_01107 [bacterium BMS3Abin10]GBE38145.1 hypothetical protein BMS3Bbin08_00747 [bacterium BMS3Bbin08]HDH49992.1 hypothetical protein [Nitrospirota bacterium]HDK17744.1 hypothetical protein [Nitrospirota bacterium]HDK82131.1 hypothetical protein [Nitrospirota bacterium]